MRTLWDYQEEQNKSNEEENELTKEQKNEKERQEILEHVSSFSVDTIRDKVAWVLNHFPEARDSDITLQASKNLFDKQLNLDQIYTVSSKTNAILKIADLLAGSANRILNRPGSSQNQKDELADYIFGHLGVDFDSSKNEQVGDLSVHISL